MSSRQGGKLKPLTKPKGEEKVLDETDIANRNKRMAEEKAMKAAAAKIAAGKKK